MVRIFGRGAVVAVASGVGVGSVGVGSVVVR